MVSSLLTDILQFAYGLLDHYAAFVTGSVLVMILGIWERAKNRPVSFRAYIIFVLAFGFVVASFQTWRQEHSERLALGAPQHWERSPETVRHLQKMYAEVSDFNRRAFALKNGSEDDFLELATEVDAWGKENGKWILENMGDAAYYKLIKNPGPIPENAADNQERARLSVVLQIMQQNLGQIVESSAWDKR